MRDRLIGILRDFCKYHNCLGKHNIVHCRHCENGSLIADRLIENGVILPPCKVGQTVYEIQPFRKRIQSYEVVTVKYNGRSWHMCWKIKDGKGVYGNLYGFYDSDLGRTVFLTREEAEKALRGEGE